MKLFWKIFAAIFITFIILSFCISYGISVKHMSQMEENLIESNKIIGTLISQEVERGYLESKWPFESLKKLSEEKNFLFWWIVKDDGTIYLANNESFMGTNANDYLPQMQNLVEGDIYLNHKQNYGIFHKSFGNGNNKWSVWWGFSLQSILEAKRNLIILTTLLSFFSLIVLGIIIFFIIGYFIKPVDDLAKCALRIKKGDLKTKCEAKSNDELGELAKSFDEMRLGLKDRNDLLNSLLGAFKGQFGNIATILVKDNVKVLVEKNPRIRKILPTSIARLIRKEKKLKARMVK